MAKAKVQDKKVFISSKKELFPLINCQGISKGYLEDIGGGLFRFTTVHLGHPFQEIVKKGVAAKIKKFIEKDPNKIALETAEKEANARRAKALDAVSALKIQVDKIEELTTGQIEEIINDVTVARKKEDEANGETAKEAAKSTADKAEEANNKKMAKEAHDQAMAFAKEHAVDIKNADTLTGPEIGKIVQDFIDSVDAEEDVAVLKAEADSLEIKYQDNIGYEKLKARIEETKQKLADDAELIDTPTDDEDDDPLGATK